ISRFASFAILRAAAKWITSPRSFCCLISREDSLRAGARQWTPPPCRREPNPASRSPCQGPPTWENTGSASVPTIALFLMWIEDDEQISRPIDRGRRAPRRRCGRGPAGVGTKPGLIPLQERRRTGERHCHGG